jgi:glycosyltransferase involved in cell wall biosynthesis
MMELVTGLDRSRFEPVIVSPGRGPLTEWAAARQLPSFVVRPRTGALGELRRSAALALLAARTRARIVHATAQTCYRAASLAGLLTRARRVCHLGFPPDAGELEWAFRFGVEAVIACYHGQVREVAPAVRRRSRAARVVAIDYGIDVSVFRPPKDGHVDAASPLRRGAGFVALIVGHLSEVKGYPWFVEAARRVAEALPQVRFLALGGETASPGYRVRLEEKIAGSGLGDRFELLGWRDDVAGVLRAADVMVLPSLAEGLPIAILEAMACARPVIGTTVNGIPEAVVDGVNGFVVPPRDAEALARAILKLARDPQLAAAMGREGRKRAVQDYGKDRYVADVQQLYQSLLSS